MWKSICAREVVINLPRIFGSLERCGRVIRTDGVPRHSELGDLLCEDPRTDMNIGTRIPQLTRGYPVPRKMGKPRGVDLH